MEKRSCLLALLAAFGALGGAADASEMRNEVLGLDRLGRSLGIPQSLCAYPGQTLRLQADVLDEISRRFFLPAESFIWRLTLSNGYWEEWDASRSWGDGVFRRGIEQDAVYVSVPGGVGPVGRLEV